jgi:hypothetical protein
VTTGPSCRPATNEVCSCERCSAPEPPIAIGAPKLRMSVISADATSRRRSGAGVAST